MPLSDARVTQLEAKYGLNLPADLAVLYSWKDGQEDDCYEAFVNNSTFLPLAQALETAAELTAMIGTDFEIENWWNAAWIPLFHNGGGDYICYDAAGIFTGQPGQILQFWHDDVNRNVIAPNLEKFLASLNSFYSTTQKETFDEYFEVENPAGFPKKFTLE